MYTIVYHRIFYQYNAVLPPTEKISTIIIGEKIDRNSERICDMKDIKLTALIPPDLLQQFQDSFSEFTGMASLITDENGVPVTVGSGFTDFCTNLTRKSATGCKRCEQCDKNGALETYRNKKPTVYRCHAGLIDYASPIIVNGKVIGSFIGGQVRTAPIDREAMTAIANDMQIDPEVYISAAEKTKILPAKVIEKAAEFLYEMAHMLSELAYTNYLALTQSRKMENAARSQSAYIMDMSINMEKNVNEWISLAKEAVGSGNKDLMETAIKEMISKSGDVRSIIGDTVDYIRMSGGEVELKETVYSPRELLMLTAGNIKNTVKEKALSLNIKIDDTVPQHLLGDPGKIGQILNKIIMGAIAYSESPAITMKALCRKESYSSIMDIEIIINGAKIPREVTDSLNDHFTGRSADDVIVRNAGSYLSPPLTAVLAKQMSGRLEAENDENGGCEFKLSIPQLEVRE